jgi:hypothetical protein
MCSSDRRLEVMSLSNESNQGKLYCTFLFSDISEWELFVAKILSEQSLVEHWFVVDGEYSFKGEFIGLCAKNLLQNEPRLSQFISRITIIENRENFFESLKYSSRPSVVDFLRTIRNRTYIKTLRKEKVFFSVEKNTRDLATASVLDRCKNSDWLFISDVDEILDSSGPRGEYIRDKLSKAPGKVLRVHRLRYVFDFDNLDPQIKFCPIVQISLLRGNRQFKISDFRFRQDGLILSGKALVFEYSYCFPLDAIKRKLQNFAHVGPDKDMFSAALRLNHHFIQPGMSDAPRVWLEQCEIEGELHAAYIIQNLSHLRTGNINPDYKLARSIEYPQLFFS